MIGIHHPRRWIQSAIAGALLSVGMARGLAQPTEPTAPKIEVDASDVTDTRDKDFGSLSVSLDIVGVPEGVERARVSISTATDDTKLNLFKTRGPDDEPDFDWDEAHANDDTLSVDARLKNPRRRAQKVTKLEGKIELLIPKRGSEASLLLSDWRNFLGRPLEQAVLKKNKISLRMLSAAQFNALSKEEREETGQGVTGITGNDILLLLSDPQHRLAQIEFQNAGGKRIESDSLFDNGTGFLWSFENPLPEDARLRLLIATPKATVKVPFALSNIELP